MIALCAQHSNPYPPSTGGSSGDPQLPRFVRWYRLYWPIITSIVAFTLGTVLLTVDVYRDWNVAPTVMPAYATFFAIAGVGLSLGKRSS